MGKNSSRIRIYEHKSPVDKCRENQPALEALRALSVWLTAGAWWNAFLSVFPAGFGTIWLYGGLAVFTVLLTVLCRKTGGKGLFIFLAAAAAAVLICYPAFRYFFLRITESWNEMIYPETAGAFSVPPDLTLGTDPGLRICGESLLGLEAAVITIPVLEVWILVSVTGRGRILAGIIIPVPVLAAAAAGYFQTERPVWVLLLAAGGYFAVCGQNAEKGGKAGVLRPWGRYLTAVGALCLMAVVSLNLGRLLDPGREIRGGIYQTMREEIQNGVIEPIESFVASEAGGRGFGEQTEGAGSGMEDLNALACFSPSGKTVRTVRLSYRPESTVYVADRYGITYTGDSWTVMEEESPEGDALLRECAVWPDGLDRLESVCSDWDFSSLRELRERISEELSQWAVYDASPGRTPMGQDFVEYFLFERGRGFCVHFASAAALLYRMNGFPARYAEGYAVPASAFSPAKNGEYEAQIDGTMGHAWCQVYDVDSGEWIDMEHTPGNGAAAEPPVDPGETGASGEQEDSGSEENGEEEAAAEEREEDGESSDRTRRESGENRRGAPAAAKWPVFLSAAAGFAAFLFLLVIARAALRRAGNRKRFRTVKEGTGITAMYESVLKTAGFLEKKKFILTEENCVEQVSGCAETVGKEEWFWMYETVMKSLFYHLDDEREDWIRADEIYHRFSEEALRKMSGGQRILYRYIYCYGG